MIDIHSHIIPFVDDGAKDLSESIEMLNWENKDGVTDIICTPHYRQSNYERNHNIIKQHFEELKEAAKNLPISLYLGQEIATKTSVSQLINKGEVFTLANSKYVLLEFDYNNYVDIESVIYDMVVQGYKPIVAHIERYEYLSETDAETIKRRGGLIQVNAQSIASSKVRVYKNRVSKLFKKGLVDFVASDIHFNREFCLKNAFNVVEHKWGNETAKRVFELNPKLIIE